MSAIDIFNQIKSLSKPYPNARSIINDQIILINKASFIEETFQDQHGKIINKFDNGHILVSCGKGSLIVEEYQIKKDKLLLPGFNFKSVSMKKTIKKILKRFKKDLHNKKINSSLLSFWLKRNLI